MYSIFMKQVNSYSVQNISSLYLLALVVLFGLMPQHAEHPVSEDLE